MQAYINRKARELSKNPSVRPERKKPHVMGDFSKDWLKASADKNDGVSALLKQMDSTVRMQKAFLMQQYHDNPEAFTAAILDKS